MKSSLKTWPRCRKAKDRITARVWLTTHKQFDTCATWHTNGEPTAPQAQQPILNYLHMEAHNAKSSGAGPMAQYGSAQPMTQYAMRAAAPGVMDYSSYLNAPTGSSLTAEQCAQLGVPIVMPLSPCAHCFILPEHSVVFALLHLLKGLLCATGHGLGSFLLGPLSATAVRSGTADLSLSGSRSGACLMRIHSKVMCSLGSQHRDSMH